MRASASWAVLSLLTLFIGCSDASLNERAVSLILSTITSTKTVSTIIKTITTTNPLVISTDVETAGTQTLIPNVLTVTFQQVPAYFYLETELTTSQISTSYKVTTTKKVTTVTSTIKLLSTSTSIKSSSSTAKKTTAKITSTTAAPSTTNTAKVCSVEGQRNQTAMNIGNRDYNLQIFGAVTTKDINECWQFCSKREGCTSFQFVTGETWNCALYNSKLVLPDGSSLVTPQAGTGTFWSELYDEDGSTPCVSCPNCHYDLATSTFDGSEWYATCPTPTAITPKTSVSDCNSQAAASDWMKEKVWASYIATDAFACQVACKRYNWDASACQSFSWAPKTKNCTLYMVSVDTTSDSKSGVYFSDIWPADGSQYCYSEKC